MINSSNLIDQINHTKRVIESARQQNQWNLSILNTSVSPSEKVQKRLNEIIGSLPDRDVYNYTSPEILYQTTDVSKTQRTDFIDNYMEMYNPVQLRYDRRTKVNAKFRVMTFGSAKGLTFDRVLIYPTQPMLNWLSGKSRDMRGESLSKFYVAVTRAKYSVGFVYKTKKVPSENIGEKWMPGE